MSEPSVSPADTIRWLNPYSGEWCDDAVSYLRGFIADPHRHDGAEARSALTALLAVGERDKAEIARLRRLVARAAVKREALLIAGERDGRQIAQLTEALEQAAKGVCTHTMHVGGCAAGLIAPKKFCPACTARAVLADKEDAGDE